jgi:hypothetical protein
LLFAVRQHSHSIDSAIVLVVAASVRHRFIPRSAHSEHCRIVKTIVWTPLNWRVRFCILLDASGHSANKVAIKPKLYDLNRERNRQLIEVLEEFPDAYYLIPSRIRYGSGDRRVPQTTG